MMKSNDPSQSLYLLIEEMRERGMKSLEYQWEDGYYPSPWVDGKEEEDFRYLSSDICISDEYDKPEGWRGFMIEIDEEGNHKISWDTLGE